MSHNRYYGTGLPTFNALDVIAEWNAARAKGIHSMPSATELWRLIANLMLTPQLRRIVYFNLTKKRYGDFEGTNAGNAIFHAVRRSYKQDGRDMEEFINGPLKRVLENANAKVPPVSLATAYGYTTNSDTAFQAPILG